MIQRFRKIERILKVQEQIHKVEEVKLANLQRQANELKATQEEIIGTMNDHEVFHGLFVDTMAKRLQALAAQEAQVERARVAQKNVAFERAMQVKRTEKMAANLAEEGRRSGEKKELLTILEALPAKNGASFP